MELKSSRRKKKKRKRGWKQTRDRDIEKDSGREGGRTHRCKQLDLKWIRMKYKNRTREEQTNVYYQCWSHRTTTTHQWNYFQPWQQQRPTNVWMESHVWKYFVLNLSQIYFTIFSKTLVNTFEYLSIWVFHISSGL